MVGDCNARSYGEVFDSVAADYDRNRPRYPEELVDDACRTAAIQSGDPVVEVGCGTGQLTRSLVARGLHVTAVEPGEQLISLAMQNLEDPGQAEFVNARFEDARLPDGRFRAVFSASAFHWIDPDVSWHRAARLLVPGGLLALIQYVGVRDEQSTQDDEALLAALIETAPEIGLHWPPLRDVDAILTGVKERNENVSDVWAWIGGHDVARSYARRLFSDVQIASIPTLIGQTADECNALLRTTSLYQRLSPNQQGALQRANVGIYQRLGRSIRSTMLAVLVTARPCTRH
jgi:SAM-dependent methyltransferase